MNEQGTPLPPAVQRGNPRLVGIGLMCGAVACFACLDATAKYLTGYMDPLQVVWARYTSAFLLALVISNPITRPGLLVTTRPWLQLGRSALLFVSTACNVIALKYLRLDQALAIIFSAPFFVTVFAVFILGEQVRWRRWSAIIVGFCGVLVVMRPGFGGIHPAALLVVAGSMSYSLYNIVTRILSRHDSSETTLFYSNLVGFLATLPVLPFVWSKPTSIFIIVLMVVVGAFGSIGHYLLIAGHRLAPASVLAPFIYTQLVWVAIFGYFVFAQLPDGWTVVGASIVVASGLYILYRERSMLRVK